LHPGSTPGISTSLRAHKGKGKGKGKKHIAGWKTNAAFFVESQSMFSNVRGDIK